MKHQLPVFLRAAFIGLSKFVLGCVLWIALFIALHECLSWSATQHYPQDGAVSPLFLVPVQTQAGGLAFRHPNQIRPSEKPQNPPQETGAYFVKTITHDYALARRYYEQAGGNKLGQAQNELATLHYNGQGTPKDDSKAFLYYQLAASNDSPEGMYNLAMMYENGFGTKRNRKLADEWYKKAYEAGFEEA